MYELSAFYRAARNKQDLNSPSAFPTNTASTCKCQLDFSLEISQCTHLDIHKNNSQTNLKTGKLINIKIN